MDSLLNTIALNLIEATLTLYSARPDGAPQLDAPVWMGVRAEGFKASARWLNVGTTPTASPAPRKHPLIPVYELSIARVWALHLADLTGFQPAHTEYVLDVVWVEEDSREWHRRTFYGVTIGAEQGFESREVDGGFLENQTFDAQRMVPDGGTGAVPVLTSALPQQVLWVGADARVWLYDYDADDHSFTALASTTGRATIAYAGDVFEVRFDGEDPTVETYASGLGATAFLQQMPLPDELPRLEFYHGGTRVATVTADGMWARSFADGAPSAGAGKFALKFGGAVVATLGVPGVTALEMEDV